MRIDFVNDLGEFAKKQLDYLGINYNDNATAHTLFQRINLYNRQYIPAVPRKVEESQVLKSRSLPAEIQISLCKLTGWIEQGVDINSYQSKTLRKRSPKDYQHFLYGARHLHLSAEGKDDYPKVNKDGFSDSSTHILVAIFQEKVAYFLDVMLHPKTGVNPELWTTRDIFAIMESDFPHLINKHRLLGVDRITEEIDDKKLNQLTFNGISTIIQTEKGIYVPPGMGVVSSGDSLENIMDTDRIFRYAYNLQKYIQTILSEFTQEIKEAYKNVNCVPLGEVDLHYDFSEKENRFVVMDRKSGCYYDPETQKLFIIDCQPLKNQPMPPEHLY